MPEIKRSRAACCGCSVAVLFGEQGLEQVGREHEGSARPPLNVTRRLVVGDEVQVTVVTPVETNSFNLPKPGSDEKPDEEHVERVSNHDHSRHTLQLEVLQTPIEHIFGVDVVRLGVTESTDPEVRWERQLLGAVDCHFPLFGKKHLNTVILFEPEKLSSHSGDQLVTGTSFVLLLLSEGKPNDANFLHINSFQWVMDVNLVIIPYF